MYRINTHYQHKTMFRTIDSSNFSRGASTTSKIYPKPKVVATLCCGVAQRIGNEGAPQATQLPVPGTGTCTVPVEVPLSKRCFTVQV